MRLLAASHALITTLALTCPAAVWATTIDMDDPRRAVGRDGDVRVDAQVLQETVTPGSPVGVIYQIQNLGQSRIAIAENVVSADYDSDSRTITLGIGAEVPQDGKMPAMVTIEPGEKKVFRGGATPALNAPALRGSRALEPRFVRVRVTIMRNLSAFANLIRLKSTPTLSDEQFDQWFESNDTIYLNAVPVRYSPRSSNGMVSAERRDAGRF